MMPNCLLIFCDFSRQSCCTSLVDCFTVEACTENLLKVTEVATYVTFLGLQLAMFYRYWDKVVTDMCNIFKSITNGLILIMQCTERVSNCIYTLLLFKGDQWYLFDILFSYARCICNVYICSVSKCCMFLTF